MFRIPLDQVHEHMCCQTKEPKQDRIESYSSEGRCKKAGGKERPESCYISDIEDELIVPSHVYLGALISPL